ncbi:MAG TPA: LEA type 2 family protein [Myxococcota bacterium]|nr:LEA type 2 family protein [Myxococcota bacterium]
MSLKTLYLGFALIGLCVSGCPNKQVKQVKKAADYAKPRLEYRGIKFSDQSFSQMNVAWKFELISEDKLPAKISGCDYRLEMTDMKTIKGTQNPGTSLAGEQKLMVATKIGLPWPETASEVMNFLQRGRIPYSFFLECHLTGPDGEFQVSASDTGSIPLPKLPHLNVTGANAEKFSSREIRLNFEISLLNENPFNIKISKIVYKISAEGKPMSEGEMPVEEVIEPSNEASYDISTGTLSGDEQREIVEMIKQPQIKYHLKGMVFLDGFELPIDDKGTVSFSH